MSTPDLLTVAECAAQARVSKMTVYRLIHGGTLPSVRVGVTYRVPADAWAAYLTPGRTRP